MLAKSVLAKIHVAKKQLAMDDDAYRAMLRSVGGVDSAKDLTSAAADRVLRHLERSGFKPVRKSNARGVAEGRPLAGDPQSTKIRALWLELHRAGVVRNPTEAALAAYVKRQTGVEALQWLSSAQASQLIEALKRWLARNTPQGANA